MSRNPYKSSSWIIVAEVFAISIFALGSSVWAGETLRFRHTEPKTVHLKDEKSAKSYQQSLKTLGVTSKLSGHAGHFDLSFHCPTWKDAEFTTHTEADKWQAWLKSLGFETQHNH